MPVFTPLRISPEWEMHTDPKQMQRERGADSAAIGVASVQLQARLHPQHNLQHLPEGMPVLRVAQLLDRGVCVPGRVHPGREDQNLLLLCVAGQPAVQPLHQAV